MTSFIIVSRQKDKRITFAKEFCAKENINPFDISLIEKDTTVKQNISTIGIDDVKQIQKKIILTPLKSKFKAIILEDAHLLTTEAQNALLKILEEPPEHTLLILGTSSKDALLPTILSRCQIIELETEALELTTRERNSITQFIQDLPEMTLGDKLKRAELLAKDKDKAIEWIEKVIVIYREKLIESVILVNEVHSESQNTHQDTERPAHPAGGDSGPSNSASKKAIMTTDLRQLQSLYITLKTTNVNPRVAIEHTLLLL